MWNYPVIWAEKVSKKSATYHSPVFSNTRAHPSKSFSHNSARYMELSGDMNDLIMLFVPPVTGVIQSGAQKKTHALIMILFTPLII